MPFITKYRRQIIDTYGIEDLAEIQPGDRCYVHYKKMVEQWKAEPRWTTAHTIYKQVARTLYTSEDEEAAAALAWDVFFALHVLEYERKKREENGDI